MIEFTKSVDDFYFAGNRMIFDAGVENAYVQRGVAKYVDLPASAEVKRGPGRPPKMDKMLHSDQVITK